MPKRRGRLAGAAVVAALAMTTAACSGSGSTSNGSGEEGQPVKGGTLNALGTGDTDYMDPNITYYTVGAWTMRPISRQLFTYPAEEGKTTTSSPDLATELPTEDNGGISSDGKTYTIKMRDDAKWNTSPARAVTAGDAVRGLKRTCNPHQPFGGIPDFAELIEGYQQFCDGFSKVDGNDAKAMGKYIESNDIAGATAKDDTTLVFKLTHPAAYFVDMLTMPAFSPAPKEWNQYLPASQELAKNFISDGPYKLDNWEPTKKIEYSRNPAWEPSSDPIRKAYVDKIVVNETVSQESVYQQLQTGTPSADIAYASSPPPSILPKLIASKDPKLDLGDTSSSNPYVVFNTASPNDNGATSKLKVRQALEYGINRDNIIQVLGGPKVNPPLDHVIPEVLVGG
ncbi:MAG: ABC transporter substrate-binding protein, partial [Nocardioidaceae bacterium]